MDLRQEFSTRLFKKLHVEPQIDLFSSRLNYQLRPFVAYQPDPEAIAINAFSISWKPYIFYAFPPFSIIPKSVTENPSRGGHRTVGCAMLAESAMVAIGNETAGSETPCASQKETHLISTSTARLGASTTPETHPADMPLLRKSLPLTTVL